MAAPAASRGGDCIDAVRRFNRFYTRRIGVLEERLLQTPFSLAEARVLFELAQRAHPTATEIGRELHLDPAYLSRILAGFRRRGLVARSASSADGRQSLLQLTPKGRKQFDALDAASRRSVGALLHPLSTADCAQLLAAMDAVQAILGGESREGALVLRPHRAGDMGWVTASHGELYAREYGWDERFEALVAKIAAGFIENFDPRRERCWIAERGGRRVGSVFLVAQTKTVAKLRLLLVDPSARGLGLGSKLVDECIAFARAAGYRKLMLWTQSNLHAARRIYERAGFRLVAKAKHAGFGTGELTSETWALKL